MINKAEELKRDHEEEWRARLVGTHPALRAFRRFFVRLPSSPRCQSCGSPFGAPFGPVMKRLGKGPFARNPRYCNGCWGDLIRRKGGAQIPLSFMFADVRGSTPLGERLGPRGLHEMMDRFYNAGVEALIEHGAIVDRFMGDQVVGYFTPGFAPRHARQAVRCGLEILRVTGHDNPPPWIPVGVGVHTGEGFIGVVGKSDELVEITALGEDVNVAARLASVALTGEAVVSEAAFVASGTKSDAERRELELKGVSTPVRVRVIKVASTRAAPEHG